MNILGIDPGTRNLGYAIISLEKGKIALVEAGLIKMKQDELQNQIPQMIEGFDLIFRLNSPFLFVMLPFTEFFR